MSQTQTNTPVQRTMPLSISKDDIGKFVGLKGMNIRKFVVIKSRNTFARDNNIEDFSSVKPPHVTIKYLTEDEIVVAECTAECDSMIDLVQSNLGKHVGNFSAKKEKIVRLVFKTRLSDNQIGKYIGSGAKNCKALASSLEEIASNKGIDASGFRIRVQEVGIYDTDKTPNKFFYIKNGTTGNDVFIHVTAKFSGSPRDLFITIKSRMIKSVTSLSQDFVNNDVPEFLSTETSTPFTPNLTNPFGGESINASASDDGDKCPDSPKYCPDDD